MKKSMKPGMMAAKKAVAKKVVKGVAKKAVAAKKKY